MNDADPQIDEVCGVDEVCNKPVFNKKTGWCAMHYYRHRRNGTTDPGPAAHLLAVDRLWAGINVVADPDACWEWMKATTHAGYGTITVNHSKRVAHRVMLETITGIPVPAGQDVHHECRNRLCCNPLHLSQLDSSIHRSRHGLGEYDEIGAEPKDPEHERRLDALAAEPF